MYDLGAIFVIFEIYEIFEIYVCTAAYLIRFSENRSSLCILRYFIAFYTIYYWFLTLYSEKIAKKTSN